MKLTIGMASYNNFQEVCFTLQSLRMFHDLTDVELLVIDNFGDDGLRDFVSSWMTSQVRYVRYTEKQGTAAPRNKVFEEAKTEWVMCIDSHIMLPLGTVSKFKEWIDNYPDCNDLLQGPMYYDDLHITADAFQDKWEGQMWGTWRTATVPDDAEPYEIPMMGLGLFACRKDAWLGFSPEFRGFGGEEGYIHEKYRQAGRKTLCLPFLKWWHYFHTRNGKVTSPYAPLLQDKIHNYLVGFAELGMNPEPVYKHFKIKQAKPLINNVQIDTNANCGSKCWYCPVRYIERPERQIMPKDLFEKILDDVISNVNSGLVSQNWNLWLSSYNDILLDPLLEQRLFALRKRGLQFTLLTNAIGLQKNVNLIHEFRDVIGGWSVNLPAGNEESYQNHTCNNGTIFKQIIAGLKALYEKDPEYYGRVVNVCINSMWAQDYNKLKYPLPENDDAVQLQDLQASLPMYKVQVLKSMCDRAGVLASHAIDSQYSIEARGCSNGGDRLSEWLHVNTFGQVYTCCNDYSEKFQFGDLRTESVETIINRNRTEIVKTTRKELCDKCVFAKRT